MSGIKYVKRIQRIESLIQRKATGSPKELANCLGVSERTVYRIIQDLISYEDRRIEYSYPYNSYIFLEKL
jgi:DeoR/GlpR family transcriptional regulator of sugar metabolism